MADLFVWSGTGGASAPYANWQTASATLVTAAAAAAAGDTIYVADDHTESAAGQSIQFTNSTYASPVKCLCVTRNGTTGVLNSGLSTGASITSTNTVFSVSLPNYSYGITYIASSASSTQMAFAQSATTWHVYDNCTFYISSSSQTGSKVVFGFNSTGQTTGMIVLKNPTFRFGNASQQVSLNSRTEVYGGSQHASSTDINEFFNIGGSQRGATALITGFDFTNNSIAGMKVFTEGGQGRATARNCKMATGWTGGPITAPGSGSNRYELLNYGITGTTGSNYKFWIVDQSGTCKDETTIYRTAGAMDEATPYSIKMQTSTTVSWPGHVLRSPPIIKRVEAAGGTTVTVHAVHDGASNYTDREVWVEVEYLGTADYPLATFADDRATLLTSSGTIQTSSGEAWTGDTGTGPNGSSNWNQIQLQVTGLTLAASGYVIATVCVAKPSTGGTTGTIYVDPKIEIS